MPRVIGIDLGTTNSAMAIITGGEPEIMENADGRRTTPSVVSVNPKTSERLIGETARRQAITNPENTIFSAKRFIGRRYEDADVQRDRGRVPFKIQALDNGDVGIMFDGQVRPPAEISAMVLRKLKEDAEAKLGEPVTQAVITVPAYFNDAQREATQVAGKIAGLEVMRIVNEPTAASLAYGLEKSGDRTIAVYDLGGGTFDVTILHVGDGVYEVLSTNGDTHLGGDDFDLRLVDFLADAFKDRELMDLRESTDRSPMQRLREEAERAKVALSTQTSTEINLPFLTADQTGPKHLSEALTRAKFEQLVSDLIDRTTGPCKLALEDAGLSADKIDDVVLVGGMTRMPAVQARVEEIFGKPPNRSINPDEVVAIGAALQAGVLQGDVTDVLLLDVTPLTWGIETQGGVRTELIPRNTTIPTTKSDTFTTAADGQTQVEIHVLQGERPMANDNTSVGRFTLDGIAPAPRGVPQIEVAFDIDADGILTVTATDKATNREQHITVAGRSGISPEEIEKLISDAESHADEDRTRREAADARNNAESLVYGTERLLSESGDGLPQALKDEVKVKLEAVKAALAEAELDIDKLRNATSELEQARLKIGEHAYGQQGGQGGSNGAGAGAGGSNTTDDDEPVEGEFREV